MINVLVITATAIILSQFWESNFIDTAPLFTFKALQYIYI